MYYLEYNDLDIFMFKTYFDTLKIDLILILLSKGKSDFEINFINLKLKR